MTRTAGDLFRKMFGRSVVLAAVAAAGVAHAQPARGPFAGYAGAWVGSGAVSMTNGSVERLRCSARYQVQDGGVGLLQNLDCASDNTRFDLRTQVEAQGDQFTGRWFEATRNAQGEIAGRIGGGRIEGSVTGPGFTATFTIHERGGRQQVMIRAQGGDVSTITAQLARAR
ncbi:MAG: hypothetical protein JO107_04680 [Hyphomicrobiales bacterium]|nr:hypothetical protein [Hyphomicrobiales bacterium]